MSYPKSVWAQLKGLTAGPLMAALEKDGWVCDTISGSIHTYLKATPHGNRRVQVHFHGKNKGWGPGLLKKMLAEIDWTEQEMRKLKLIS